GRKYASTLGVNSNSLRSPKRLTAFPSGLKSQVNSGRCGRDRRARTLPWGPVSARLCCRHDNGGEIFSSCAQTDRPGSRAASLVQREGSATVPEMPSASEHLIEQRSSKSPIDCAQEVLHAYTTLMQGMARQRDAFDQAVR